MNDPMAWTQTTSTTGGGERTKRIRYDPRIRAREERAGTLKNVGEELSKAFGGLLRSGRVLGGMEKDGVDSKLLKEQWGALSLSVHTADMIRAVETALHSIGELKMSVLMSDLSGVTADVEDTARAHDARAAARNEKLARIDLEMSSALHELEDHFALSPSMSILPGAAASAAAAGDAYSS